MHTIFGDMVIVIIDPMEILTRFNFFAVIVLSCPAVWVAIVIHLAHKQYRKNHPKPISKDAQTRGLKSCVVNQQTTINDYKKTVADLVRAYALKKARKQLALAVVLGLFLFSIVNPAPSLMPLAIGNELNEKPFFAAGDGAQSSDSIYSFTETLDDDVLQYPDYELAYPMTDFNTAADFEGWTEKAGSEFESLTADGSKVIAETAGDNSWHILEHSVDYGVGVEGYTFWIRTKFNYTTTSGLRIILMDSGVVVNTTILTVTSYWLTSEILYYSDEGAIDSLEVWIADYTDPLSVEIDFIYFNCSSNYADSFFDVSDWTLYSNEGSETITSDDDVGTFAVEAYVASYDPDYMYSDTVSLTGSYYYEIRYRLNITTVGSVVLCGYSTEGFGSNVFWQDLTKTTSWITKKFYDSDTLERVAICLVKAAAGQGPIEIDIDYLRIAPADEMGFGHDGSTTAGLTADNDAHFDYVFSSDGDNLNITTTVDTGSSNNGDALLVYDTTATATDLEDSNYPFFVMNYKCAVDGGKYYVYARYGGKSAAVELTTDNAWHTVRWNVAAGSSTGSANILFRYYRSVIGETAKLLVNWTKAFSIANFSSIVGHDAISKYLYVDNDVLYSTDDYMELLHDPTLAVSTNTYNVANITTGSGDDVRINFYYGGGVWEGYKASGETRWGLTSDKTVSDFNMRFYAAGYISAIKFIEDGTAPDILDKFIDPGEPYDDETVTVMTVAYDGQEVYKCTINAVVCPAAFSDVDYEMTEIDQEHVFTYAFSSLTAGYYLFQIQVSDGANTYEEYISVRVREAEILITTYTFFGASSDFSYMQFSGYISRDCTYNILEWSDSWAKNETHTGSVTEGMFNIAWDKIGVDDLEANFTIVFVNGSLSKTIPGYYGTAYKELRITEIEVHNPEESQANTSITVNFYTNKDIDWFVYDVDDNDAVLASGSSVEGSDVLTWLKDRTPFIHNYAIKWTDGVSNIWFNSSYWTYRENIDSIDQPGLDAVAADKRRTIEFWTTLTAIVVIVGFAVIGISHYNLDKKIKALQLPHYKTQEK